MMYLVILVLFDWTTGSDKPNEYEAGVMDNDRRRYKMEILELKLKVIVVKWSGHQLSNASAGGCIGIYLYDPCCDPFDSNTSDRNISVIPSIHGSMYTLTCSKG